MRKRRVLLFAVPTFVVAAYSITPVSASGASGLGYVPQGIQSNTSYAHSFAAKGVTNVFATSQQTSCYTPEVPYFRIGAGEGYSGMSACTGATTGETLGPYATQAGSKPGYPATTPMLVKDHSESDIRVDPNHPNHLIGTSKWIVSPEGYNHLLGFFESWDGGKTWPVQGHIPGYEGWTDNTDPVGDFDSYGNFYAINLPYQFFYNGDTHDFQTGSKEPNPSIPNDVISMSVWPASAQHDPNGWISTVTKNGVAVPDYIATYDSSSNGNGPDKEWVTIDRTNPARNIVYAMWVDFHFATPVPWVSTAIANPDGTHTPWSTPVQLPEPPHMPQGETYLLPHVDASGNVWTTLTNFEPKKGYCCVQIFVDKLDKATNTWSVAGIVNPNFTIVPPPLEYANTQMRDGIENSFAVGNQLDTATGFYPLFVSYEDYSLGYDNVIIAESKDGGASWINFRQVNDNPNSSTNPVDAFQPNLTVAPDGTVSDAFYDRRLACPAQGTAAAVKAGLALDTVNLNYSGSLPPYGATNYCVNSTIQFYDENLKPIGNNIRTSAHTWDPQLNEPRPAGFDQKEGFIGDYYGNIVTSNSTGLVDVTTSVSTYNDGSNPYFRQQQVIAQVAVP